MGRILIGALAAAVAMFIIGFILFATPLSKLAYTGLDNARAASVQQALAVNLPKTGTYAIPGMNTPEQTIMYGQGPVATVHYNTSGFSAADPRTLMSGFVLELVVALMMGAALAGIAGYITDFAARARVVVLFSVAASAFIHLGEPIWYHHDWAHFVYLFVADALALSAGGLVIARWFLGGIRPARAIDAPSDV